MKFLKTRTGSVVAGASVLVVAGGIFTAGGAVAAATIGSPDIKNQSIKSVDIAKNGVGVSEIRKNSVGFYNELNPYTRDKLTTDDELADAIANVETQPGEDGADGADGVSGYEVNSLYTRNNGEGLGNALTPGEVRQFVVPCPDGKVALGGGVSNGNTQPGTDLTVRESHPGDLTQAEDGSWHASSWVVTVQNETDSNQHGQAFATCAAVN